MGWVSLSEAQTSGKPVMLIVTKPTCPRCRALKAKLVEHEGFRSLTGNFAMVHLPPEQLPQEDEEDARYRPDGRYVPRILFYDEKFNFLPEVRGADTSHNYYYGEPDNVETSMLRALYIIDIRRRRR